MDFCIMTHGPLTVSFFFYFGLAPDLDNVNLSDIFYFLKSRNLATSLKKNLIPLDNMVNNASFNKS